MPRARTLLLPALLLGLAAPSAAGAAHPQIAVGGFPTGIALNPTTHTIYVGNGTTGTLSLIDGKTCNAQVASGCGQRVTAVTAGVDPIGIAVDESTNTVYVTNAGSNTVTMLDGRTCNGRVRSGCRLAGTTA